MTQPELNDSDLTEEYMCAYFVWIASCTVLKQAFWFNWRQKEKAQNKLPPFATRWIPAPNCGSQNGQKKERDINPFFLGKVANWHPQFSSKTLKSTIKKINRGDSDRCAFGAFLLHHRRRKRSRSDMTAPLMQVCGLTELSAAAWLKLRPPAPPALHLCPHPQSSGLAAHLLHAGAGQRQAGPAAGTGRATIPGRRPAGGSETLATVHRRAANRQWGLLTEKECHCFCTQTQNTKVTRFIFQLRLKR